MRLFGLGAGLLIHATSLLGEFGFGAEEIEEFKRSELLRSDASAFRAYIPACERRMLHHQFFNGSMRTNNEKFNSMEECWVRRSSLTTEY